MAKPKGETKKCNVPGCDKDAHSRGICKTHLGNIRYHLKTSGKSELEKYLDPSKRVKKERKEKHIAPEKAETALAESRPSKRIDEVHDLRIAAKVDVLLALGYKMVRSEIGMQFRFPSDMLLREHLLLDKDGDLREFQVSIGDVIKG